MDLSLKYHVGKTYHSFRFTKALPIEELQLVLYELEHIKTGARVIHLACDDLENLFCLSFQTLPFDSTGVAHILEHTVLCGSKKFPIHDPFFSMSRRSLHTFMNALTGSDFTCYPAASQVEKDFYNLLEVYLDAVFFPELKKLSFLQEGHRLEFKESSNPNSPLLFKGVVFNEMKGSLSHPETRLFEEISKNLTPDLTYAHNSGGNPKQIPSLSYKELKDFHKRFYHPSHALFFFYGNLPLEKHLDCIEKQVLFQAKKTSPLHFPSKQARFKSPIQKEAFYPLNEENPKQKSFIAFAFLTTEIENQEDLLALSVIDSILMETDASPLKYALLKSGLCTQADGFLDADMSEIPYIILCRGTSAENQEKLKKILFDTLKVIVLEGIDHQKISAAIFQLQFERLEISSDYGPFGLTLFMRSALLKQHGCSSEKGLMVYERFQKLQSQVQNPSYLTGLIQKYFIDNPHYLCQAMHPDPTLEKKEIKEEKEKLKQIQSNLSKKEKETILKQTQELENYREKIKHQSLDCLPKIHLGNVPKEVLHFPLSHVTKKALNIFTHTCFSNHIVYADLLFKLPQIDQDELCYLQLLLTLLPQLGCGKRTYKENLDFINAHLGNFKVTYFLYPQTDNPDHLNPCFALRAKTLEHNIDKLFTLFIETCHSYRFDEKERIKELILQIETSLQNHLNQHALSYAILTTLSPLTSSATIHQKLGGLPYFKFIQNLVQKIDQKLPLILEKLNSLAQKLFHLNQPHLVLSCDEKILKTIDDENYFDLGELNPKPLTPWSFFKKEAPKKAKGYTISSPIAFSAYGFKTSLFSHAHAPALSIASYLLENTFLHKKIREEGGAYGSGACYNPSLGHFYFYSYRDPHIASTYHAFKESISQLARGHFTEQELEEAKLGFFQKSDTPILPGNRASLAYARLCEKRTKKVRQQFRNHIFKVSKNALKKAVQVELEHVKEKGFATTFSNRSLLEKENKRLENIFSISEI